MIRITGGAYRGRVIKGPKGKLIRPTTARIKLFLFSSLGEAIEGARILDLFAGTGSLGIEALSRGADSVTFVEKDREQVRLICENLGRVGLEQQSRVIWGDVFEALPRLARGGDFFDLILADPPFREDLHNRILEVIAAYPVLKSEGLLYIEHERHDVGKETPRWVKLRERVFGHCVVSVYRMVQTS